MGMKQAYNLGVYLKKRYKTLLGDTFKRTEVAIVEKCAFINTKLINFKQCSGC